MSNLPETQALELVRDGSWLQIRFNQPERRNCLSNELAGELRAVFTALQTHTEIRGVSMRGNGGMFCAGGDLKEFQRIGQAGADARQMAVEMSHSIAEILLLISTAPQLTVSLLEGAAMAGGFGVACAADIVVATPDCRFALTETRIGLTPAQIAPYVIPRVGLSRGRRLLLLGADFNGQEAFDMGIVDELAADSEGLASAEAGIRKQLQHAAPGGVAATKKVIRMNNELAIEEFIGPAAEIFADCLVSSEGQEGFASFLQKKKPSWLEN